MKKTYLIFPILILLLIMPFLALAQEEEEEELDCPAFEDSSADVRIGYYMGEGGAFRSSGQLAEAVHSYSCIIEQIDENYTDAYIQRALIHGLRRSFDLAIEDYSKIIELDGSSVAAINNRALVYIGRQEYEEALADFNQAIDTDPNYIPAYVNRGVLNAITEDYDAALEDFQTVVDLAGLQAAVDWYNAPTRDAEGNTIDKGEVPEYDRSYARVYAMMGIIDAMRSLDDFNTYITLSGGSADRRVESAAGALESRSQFDLRFDDGTWVILDDFLPDPEEQ